jgi:ribonucleoside-diphosphate reductase beta chain
MSVIESELAWVDHIFQHGTMIGVNGDILKDFILFRAAKCMNAVFVTPRFDHPKASPLPWMSHWLNESDVQVANQETENTSYTLSMQNDLETGSFKGIEL